MTPWQRGGGIEGSSLPTLSMEEYDEEYDDNSWKRAAGSITFYGLVTQGPQFDTWYSGFQRW